MKRKLPGKSPESNGLGWGYIKLYRKLTDNEIYFREKFDPFHAWIDLLLLANYKDSNFYIRGITIPLKPGQLARSQVTLADRWGWNFKTVKKFLDLLVEKRMITYSGGKLTTVITILNWKKYQTNGEQNQSTISSSETNSEESKGEQTGEQNGEQNLHIDGEQNLHIDGEQNHRINKGHNEDFGIAEGKQKTLASGEQNADQKNSTNGDRERIKNNINIIHFLGDINASCKSKVKIGELYSLRKRLNESVGEDNIKQLILDTNWSHWTFDSIYELESFLNTQFHGGDFELANIFSFWNDKKITPHRRLTDRISSEIKKTLKVFSTKEIKTAISNYSEILNGSEYFFNYRWTLADFLQRGLEKFLDLQTAKNNYRNRNKVGTNDQENSTSPYKYL